MPSNLPEHSPDYNTPSAYSEERDDLPESPEAGRQLERYLAAIVRRKWIIVLITALGTAAGVAASRFIQPEYRVQATLWVEVESRSAESRGPIRSDQLLASQAWIELLRSFQVLDHVVKQQRLYLEAAPADSLLLAGFGLQQRFRPGTYQIEVGPDGKRFSLTTAEGLEVGRGSVGEPVAEEIGFDWTPDAAVLKAGREARFTVRNPREVAVELSRDLQTNMADDGNFLRLSLAGTDPSRTTSTLNAVVDRYIEVAAELKRAKLVELTDVLEEQRAYAEDNLRSAEIELESFRVATVTLPSDAATPVAPGLQITRDPVFSHFFEMKIEREQLREDREAVERVLGRIEESPTSIDALAAIASVQSHAPLTQVIQERTAKRAELRALLQRYTPEHRSARRLMEEVSALERVTIPQMAANLRDQLVIREAELEEQISSASGELREIPPRTIEEARLQRRVAIADNLHTTLKQRYEEARLAAASSIPDIRLLDEAVVPFDPVKDQRPMVMVLGLLGGLGLSVLGTILLDRADPRVRYPEQITRGMGLHILAAIPRVKNIGDGKSAESASHAAEALRELRLNLLHAHGAAGPVVLTLTSPESGDGKSFVASNLALSFADQGHRTLLIDGDTRRGRLHHLYGGRRTPGLTDFLSGTAEVEEIIQETPYPSVFFVGAGTRMSNGPELLASSRMTGLVAHLGSRFDSILVDSPPLGAGVDPYILGTVTRNLLLVVRNGNTNRAFAEAKLEMLDRFPIRILGAVLNDISASKIYRYYSYLPGYEAREEENAAETLQLGGV